MGLSGNTASKKKKIVWALYTWPRDNRILGIGAFIAIGLLVRIEVMVITKTGVSLINGGTNNVVEWGHLIKLLRYMYTMCFT